MSVSDNNFIHVKHKIFRGKFFKQIKSINILILPSLKTFKLKTCYSSLTAFKL